MSYRIVIEWLCTVLHIGVIDDGVACAGSGHAGIDGGGVNTVGGVNEPSADSTPDVDARVQLKVRARGSVGTSCDGVGADGDVIGAGVPHISVGVDGNDVDGVANNDGVGPMDAPVDGNATSMLANGEPSASKSASHGDDERTDAQVDDGI